MASLRPRADHQQAAARRLELLTAELAAGRDDLAGADPDPADPWLDGHTRIRPLRAVPDPAPVLSPPDLSPPDLSAPDLSPPAPVVPVPGRHAARRSTGGRTPTVLPEVVRGRIALGPSQLVVVAVLVAMALAAAAWWVVRGDPERLEAPAPASSGADTSEPLAASSPVAASASPTSATAGAGATGAGSEVGEVGEVGEVTVDVAGKVRKPGIVVIEAGSRVVDAIEAAGGARDGVDLTSLNLARVLVDGEQVVVGRPAGTAVAPTAAASTGGPAPGVLVNLNTATQAELESLPEVGPVTAQSILSWRSEHGGFTAVDELLEVDGIGDATLAQITPYVTV